MDVIPRPKPKTWRSKSYLDTVRMRRCLFCGKPGPNEAHHISLGDAGWGTKSSDLGCIPLCTEHHRLYHDDPAKFRKTVDSLEIYDCMYNMLKEWVEEKTQYYLICPVCLELIITDNPFLKHCNHYAVEFDLWNSDKKAWLTSRDAIIKN
jgi:hypothetical protein